MLAHAPRQLQLSTFDRTSSFLMAVFAMIGIAVGFMFLIWLFLQFDSFKQPILVHPMPPSGTRNPPGVDRDFEPPGAAELLQMVEPTLAAQLQAVTNAASKVAAAEIANDSPEPSSSIGTSQGDERPPGPDAVGHNIIPAHERWDLRFSANSRDEYARQLDTMGIELGAITRSESGIHYASKFTEGSITRHSIDTASETRLYFQFPRGTALDKWNRQLITEGGVPASATNYVMLFLPRALQSELETIELRYAVKQGVEDPTKIFKSVFEIAIDGDDVQFKVIKQRYRP